MTREEARALLPVEWSGEYNDFNYYAGVYKNCTIFLPLVSYYGTLADVAPGYGCGQHGSVLSAVRALPAWKVAHFGVIL